MQICRILSIPHPHTGNFRHCEPLLDTILHFHHYYIISYLRFSWQQKYCTKFMPISLCIIYKFQFSSMFRENREIFMKTVYTGKLCSNDSFTEYRQKVHFQQEQRFFPKFHSNPLTNISECDIIFITEADITEADRSESDKGGII